MTMPVCEEENLGTSRAEELNRDDRDHVTKSCLSPVDFLFAFMLAGLVKVK